MNKKLLLLISVLTTMIVVVACTGAQQDVGDAQPDVASSAQTETFLSSL